ncbi:MAG: UpxY family transcription antiterminator [Ignavibacteriaceae bacterium]|nr:UpxY family transcription antiterminator [Ignavibacteriaceae bacterium]
MAGTLLGRVSSSEKNWYALYTKPRNEFKAAQQLESAGVNFYLPTYIKISQWSDRKKKITEPLLRGYIFIFSSERERILSLEQPSIVRCVCERGMPARIPEWQIDNLKKMLATNADFHIKEGLVPGVKVKIKDGPFQGVIGVIQEAEMGKSIVISIDLLNRSVMAHLPAECNFEIIR